MRRLWLTLLLALLAVPTLARASLCEPAPPPPSPPRDKEIFGETSPIGFRVRSPHTMHDHYKPVSITPELVNRTATTQVLESTGPVKEPQTPRGLAEPRPVLDVVLIGAITSRVEGPVERYVWLLSEVACPPLPVRLRLAPGERWVREVVWLPPPGMVVQGRFHYRFGSREGPLSVSIQPRTDWTLPVPKADPRVVETPIPRPDGC